MEKETYNIKHPKFEEISERIKEQFISCIINIIEERHQGVIKVDSVREEYNIGYDIDSILKLKKKELQIDYVDIDLSEQGLGSYIVPYFSEGRKSFDLLYFYEDKLLNKSIYDSIHNLDLNKVLHIIDILSRKLILTDNDIINSEIKKDISQLIEVYNEIFSTYKLYHCFEGVSEKIREENINGTIIFKAKHKEASIDIDRFEQINGICYDIEFRSAIHILKHMCKNYNEEYMRGDRVIEIYQEQVDEKVMKLQDFMGELKELIYG